MVASHLDRTVYLNGRFIPARDAKVSIFDRGLLFADAVYEGFGVIEANIIDIDVHLERLQRSLAQLRMPEPMSIPGIADMLNKLIGLNEMSAGFVYLHITRGEADRDYCYGQDMSPNVFAFVQPFDQDSSRQRPPGLKMITHPDLRWKRRDIKTSNLLGQVIAKQAAQDAGGQEALMIDEQGYITEGGATSFFIITDSAILARPVTNDILHGVTRRSMLKVAEQAGLKIEKRLFTLEQALSAEEAFLTGASSYIEPVVQIDGHHIGDGLPGPITLKLRSEYLQMVRS